MVKIYLYSPVHSFVIAGTDENGENCYMTNNNHFTVLQKPVSLSIYPYYHDLKSSIAAASFLTPLSIFSSVQKLIASLM